MMMSSTGIRRRYRRVLLSSTLLSHHRCRQLKPQPIITTTRILQFQSQQQQQISRRWLMIESMTQTTTTARMRAATAAVGEMNYNSRRFSSNRVSSQPPAPQLNHLYRQRVASAAASLSAIRHKKEPPSLLFGSWDDAPRRHNNNSRRRWFASSSAPDPVEDQQPHQPTSSAAAQQSKKAQPQQQEEPPEPIVRGAVVSPEEVRQEETKRQRLSEVKISEVLKAKHSYRWVEPVLSKDATVKEAIATTIDGGLSGMMILENHDSRRVVGLLTSRDLLRIMALGIKENEDNDMLLSRKIGDFMTPISQVIYGRPDETIGMCRTIMAKLGIKCLPILSRQGTVEGLITARDMSDYGLSAKDKGGKKSFLNDVSERVGLSSNTSMAEPPQYLRAHLALTQSPLFVTVGNQMLPHPFKTPHGAVGRSRKEVGQTEYSSDPDLSEDAYFMTGVRLPDESKDGVLRNYTYLGVADGVGSWREYDVDPRDFSRRLMQECENILREVCHDHGATIVEGGKFRQVIAPAEIMAQAYERVKAENIIGSSTACVALFDGLRHQLHFSNLGDSGLIILRHIDSDVAGALRRDKTKPRAERTSDLRLAFVSQQQLRSFNHPFQLGWTGEELDEGESSSFKDARNACTSSVHLRRGDIIVVATDGLFDNVDADEICEICLEWEQKNGFIRSGDIVARERRWAMGNSLANISAERIGDLADALCKRARDNSLNSEIDSPFAILAKENDIMWSGGMPDDCTVVAIHVTGVDANDVMDREHK